jgi:hypothetical protein
MAKPSKTTDTTASEPVDVKQTDGDTETYYTIGRTGRKKLVTRKKIKR